MRELTLLFLRRENEILLAMKKRGFGAGKWNGVGGKLEPGETIEEAAVREAQEEIGVVVTRYHKVAELEFIKENDSDWHMYVHTFIADEWEGEPSETEEMAPSWYKIHDIPYDKMWEDDQFHLPRILAGEKLMGVFRFDEQERMISHDITAIENF